MASTDDRVVSVREFRRHLAEHLARAADGDRILITRHGRPDCVVRAARLEEDYVYVDDDD
jgi:prevent-host-death family protein